MRYSLYFIALFAAQGASAQSPSTQDVPEYTLSGSPEDGLTFAFESFPMLQGPAVDAIIEAEAKRRCSPRIPYQAGYQMLPGEVQWQGRSVQGMQKYQRLLLCIDPIEPGEPAPADFKPTAADQRDAANGFEAYFAAYERGDVDAVMRQSDVPVFPRKMVTEQIAEDRQAFGDAKRTAFDSSWIANPENFGHNGIYVEFAYYRPLSATSTQCGAAMFYRRGAGDFVLSRNLTQTVGKPVVVKDGAVVSNPCKRDKTQLPDVMRVVSPEAEAHFLSELPLLKIEGDAVRIFALKGSGDRSLLDAAANALAGEGWDTSVSVDETGAVRLFVHARKRTLDEMRALSIRFARNEFGAINIQPMLFRDLAEPETAGSTPAPSSASE